MSNLIIQALEKEQAKQDLPEIKAGYTVRVHQKIKEGEKERVQVYEGLVIAISHGHGHNKTITVRKMVEGIGVEKIFSLSSPNVIKIEVVRIGKVRRAKLYYMRNISGKAARLKEVMVSDKAVAGKGSDERQEVAAEEAAADTAAEGNDQATEETAAEVVTESNAEVVETAPETSAEDQAADDNKAANDNKAATEASEEANGENK